MTADRPDTGLDVTALREVAEAATPGPWHACGDSPVDADSVVVNFGHDPVASAMDEWHDPFFGPSTAVADAAHIATFDPPTVLALLAEVERLRAEVEMAERNVSALADARDDWQAEADRQREQIRNLHEVVDREQARLSAFERDAAEAREQALRETVARVEALHVRRETPIREHECWEGDCDHGPEDYDGPFPTPDCPVLADAVCAHCADQTEPDEAWEHMIRPAAFWPCATIRAALGVER